MRLIHLTDLHLTSLIDESFRGLRGKRRLGYLSWSRRRRRIHRPEILERLIDAVAAEDADQILISGDLVQIGLPAEIVAARGTLLRLGPSASVTLVPGNHDLYAADSWAAVRQHWGEYLHLPPAPARGGPQEGYPVVREMGDMTLIALSSACPTPALMASGRLGAGQLARLAEQLADSAGRGRFCCLLMHHPPLPRMVPWRKALADAGALERVLRGGPVQLVLHGHVHRNCELKFGQTAVYGTASASSSSASAPAAYRRFDLQADGAGWRVEMCLKSPTPGRGMQIIDEATWRVSPNIA